MQYYQIARIVNTFGIQGELKVISDTDFPEERFAPGSKLVILKDREFVADVTVERSRLSKGTYIIKFQEYHNINQVEQYKGMWLGIREDQQGDLDEDEYYYHEIEGLQVYTIDGEHLGHIREILALGSNDVWVVQPKAKGRKDILIPYIGDFVKDVDLAQERVTVELMEGLIDDED